MSVKTRADDPWGWDETTAESQAQWDKNFDIARGLKRGMKSAAYAGNYTVNVEERDW